MVLLIGVVITAAALALLIFSLRQNGKSARFVESEWEGYIVVGMICTLGCGPILVLNEAARWV
jgi:hypothetical protein